MSSSDRHLPALAVRERADGRRQRATILRRVDQPGTSHQDLAEVFGQPLVDPEQPRLHRGLEIGGAHAGGAAELAAPGMDVFMRQQVGHPAPDPRGVEQVALANPVDAALEVLQAQVAEVVAARDQEMERRIMAGAEQGTRLSDDPAVDRHHLGPDLECGRRLRRQVEEGRRILAGIERDLPHVLAGDHRIVDQIGQGNAAKLDRLAAARRIRVGIGLEGAGEVPRGRQPQGHRSREYRRRWDLRDTSSRCSS